MAPHRRTLDPVTEKRVAELRNQAKVLLAQHNYEDALDALDQAIDLNADSYKIVKLRVDIKRATVQFKNNEIDDVFPSLFTEDAARVIELAPTIMDGYYHRGFAEYHQKNYVEAAHAFQGGLRINPSDKAMQQGFWDAITLVSQNRADATAIINAKEEAMRNEAAVVAAAAKQALADAHLAAAKEQQRVQDVQAAAAATAANIAIAAAAAATAEDPEGVHGIEVALTPHVELPLQHA